tara:strand:+ start:2045 stop:2248 length:204 start_codon:yes stop_codon:yes gene_type:complete
LLEIGLPSIKFHAPRAYFANSILAKGISATIVIKICVWRDLKTMGLYIRVAGVDGDEGEDWSRSWRQ